jgi:hypothetical protein
MVIDNCDLKACHSTLLQCVGLPTLPQLHSELFMSMLTPCCVARGMSKGSDLARYASRGSVRWEDVVFAMEGKRRVALGSGAFSQVRPSNHLRGHATLTSQEDALETIKGHL